MDINENRFISAWSILILVIIYDKVLGYFFLCVATLEVIIIHVLLS